MEAKLKIINLVTVALYTGGGFMTLWTLLAGVLSNLISWPHLVSSLTAVFLGMMLSLVVDAIEMIDNIDREQIRIGRKVDELLENARNSE